MRIIKSFFIAFSMYSKIPMPQFQWKDEDMRYALCFFPWVGAVIGALWYLWKWFCDRFGVGTLCYTVVGTAIPILITGGFHVDGFLDIHIVHFDENMLIGDAADLDSFMEMYGVEAISKEYL